MAISGFGLGGMAGGITNAANNISNDMNLVATLQLQEARQQSNQKHADFMKLRSDLVSHLGETMKQLRIAHPNWTDNQLIANPAVVAMKNQLQTFTKNLKLPDDSDSIVAGFAATPSEATTARALSEATGTYGKNQAETSELNARTNLLNKTAQGIQGTPTNPDLDTSTQLGGQQPDQETADSWLMHQPNADDIKAVYEGRTPLSTFSTRTYKGQTKSQRQLIVEGAERYGQLSGVPFNAAGYKANEGSTTAGVKADSASLVNLTKQRDAVEAFSNTAKANGDKLVEMAKGISDTGIPALNKYTRWYEGNIKGDPAISNFNLQLISVRNEIAKILTNPNLTGQLTDASKNEIQEAMQPGATAAQIIGAFKTAKNDFANRHQFLDEQIALVNGRLQQRKGGKNPNDNSSNITKTYKYNPDTGELE